jgi:hypothetical protein
MKANPRTDVSAYKLAYTLSDLPWGRTTTYKLINGGLLRAVKVGRKTLILVDDLESCLRSLQSIPVNKRADGASNAAAEPRGR